MANSPNNLLNKAFLVAGIIAASATIGMGTLWGTSALAGNTTYQYDALGRVIKVIYPDSKQICYAYDSAGNRTQVKRQATGSCSVSGSTLTSALMAETMLVDQQSRDLQTDSVTTSETDSQVAADSATAATPATDDNATTN